MDNPHQGSRWLEIEAKAEELRAILWRDRYRLWDGSPPDNKFQALEPGVALYHLGYDAVSSDFLGVHNVDGTESEIAGEMDRERRVVTISRRFPMDVQLFTAAHEVAHIVLHPDVQTLHRDLPVNGARQARNWREREADYFAACLLMPSELVREQFRNVFGVDRFELTDDTAFALFGTSQERVLRSIRCERDLARRLAEANRYWTVPVHPLNQVFGVSVTAMAIRLEELGLVEPPKASRMPPPFLRPR